MTRSIGRNVNTTDEPDVVDPQAVGDTTAVKIADANPDRMGFTVNNGVEPSKAVWIREIPASVDATTKKGRILHEVGKGIGTWNMEEHKIYTGEISAISESGTNDVYVTEY